MEENERPPARHTRSERLSDQVYAFVFANILEGTFEEGSRLPTEGHLAEQFGISRPIVREALARLANDGLIYSRRGAGSFVQARPSDSGSRFGHLGSVSDLEKLHEFRAEVEAPAAALAAERAGPDDLARIQRAMEAFEKGADTKEVGIASDYEFHLAVTSASGNRFFLTTLESLQDQISFGMLLGRQFSLLRPQERNAIVVREHAAIFDAITRRDAEAARKAMRDHLRSSSKRTFEGDSAAAADP